MIILSKRFLLIGIITHYFLYNLDYYLSWPSPLSNKLKLKKHTPVEMLMPVENFEECQFEIINFDMIR